jgi:hypothetical protein
MTAVLSYDVSDACWIGVTEMESTREPPGFGPVCNMVFRVVAEDGQGV